MCTVYIFYTRMRINYSVPSIYIHIYRHIQSLLLHWPTTVELIGYGCGMRLDYIIIYAYTYSRLHRTHIFIRWGFNDDDKKIKWHVDDLILTWRENELTENVNGRATVCMCVCVCHLFAYSQCHKMKSIIQCKYSRL